MESEEVAPYAHIIDLFLCGKLPNLNHARHVAVARILKHVPHGRELMHLGIQVTATRAGVPGKYSREVTDAEWEKVEPGLPDAEEFSGLLSRESSMPALRDADGRAR